VISDVAQALAASLQSVAGKPLVCRRGSQAVELTGTVGTTAFESVNESGIIEQFQSRDFLVSAADYAFGLPQRGDQIDDGQFTYEVMSAVPYRFSDTSRTILRIHTKQVKRA
jgi:hypothetical protein